METWLVGIAAALLGAFIGHRKWLTELRLSHYATYLEALQSFAQTVRSAKEWPITDEDTLATLRGHGIDVIRATQKVALSGTRATAAATRRGARSIQPVIRHRYSSKDDYVQDLNGAIDDFLWAGRADAQWGVASPIVRVLTGWMRPIRDEMLPMRKKGRRQ